MFGFLVLFKIVLEVLAGATGKNSNKERRNTGRKKWNKTLKKSEKKKRKQRQRANSQSELVSLANLQDATSIYKNKKKKENMNYFWINNRRCKRHKA